MKPQKNSAESLLVTVLVAFLLIFLSVAYNACYPCLKWETRQVYQESCTSTGTALKTQRCTGRWVEEQVCVEREGDEE